VAVANANPTSVESCTRPQRKAWRGRALVVVKAADRPGDVHLRVSSAGVPTATATIEVR
jgi:beta-galactosidase